MKTIKKLLRMRKKAIIFCLSFILFTSIKAQNTFYGVGSLSDITTGTHNSAFGAYSLTNTTIGSHNSGVGSHVMFSNTSGSYNTALGSYSLYRNTTGRYNSAVGYNALYSNTSGYNNIAIGYRALYYNTTGNYNIAIGNYSLYRNSTGSYNTATGYQGLYSNTTGRYNTAIGYQGLNRNTTGIQNTATGYQALYSNSTGSYNTATGYYALRYNTTGAYNTATGTNTLRGNTTGRFNTAVGRYALYRNTTGRFNTSIGYFAGGSTPVDAVNTTSIGYSSYATASNRVKIGNNNVTRIGGVVGWSILSDGRFKKNIKEDVPGIEFIQKLRPVSYNYNLEEYNKHTGFSIDSLEMDAADKTNWIEQQKKCEGITYSGFIAQEVEALVKNMNYKFSGVSAPESDKDHYAINYSEFVVPLVKATQQQQEELIALKNNIAELKRENEELKQLVMKTLSGNAIKESKEVYTMNIENKVSCYPNPNNGVVQLNVKNNDQENVRVSVYNMAGELISQENAYGLNPMLTLDISGEPAGTYIVKTLVGSRTYQNKIIVE